MAEKRVLIVDDEALSRTIMRDFLEMAGYAVAESGDGPEGLAKAKSLRPDIILLDVLMPGLDGYEVCRRLKADPTTSPIPVVFVTVVQDPALNRLAYEAGAVACLMKPFRREALVAIIETALANAARQTRAKSERKGNGP